MSTTQTEGFALTRVFDAPVNLVWRAWTESEHLSKWSAPPGYTIVKAEGDLRVGGRWRCCMRDSEGREHWLGGVYRAIVPHKLLSMTHAWDDDSGKPGHETVVTVRFEDLGNRTKITLEQTGFDSMQSRDGHHEGWSQCLDLLEQHLAATRG